MASPGSGILHSVFIHDDDWAVAGTNLAAADFIEGEDTVQLRQFAGKYYAPSIYEIVSGVYDTVAANVGNRTELRVQPNTWPVVERITTPAKVLGLTMSDSASTTANTVRSTNVPRDVLITPRLLSHPRNPLPTGTSFVNAGNSQVLATTANEDCTSILYQLYRGAPGSYRPDMTADGYPRVDTTVTRKAAGAAAAAADVFDDAINERLSDDTPGTDPNALYLVVGLAIATDAATDIALGCRFQAKSWGANVWQGALGSGLGTERTKTWFTDGLLAMRGDSEVQVQNLMTGTTDTPNLEIYLQKLTAAIGPAPPAAAIPGPGGGINLGSILGGALGGFGGAGMR